MNPPKKSKTQKNAGTVSRREAIKKTGLYALSTSTLLILMETQARAQTSPASPPGGGGFD